MNGFTYLGDFKYRCDTCRKEVPCGIINIAGHWAECAGKARMDIVNKICDSALSAGDRIDLIKNEFNITP